MGFVCSNLAIFVDFLFLGNEDIFSVACRWKSTSYSGVDPQFFSH